MRNIYIDIEANGLLDDVTKIHVIGVKDIENGEEIIFTDEGLFGYPSIQEDFIKFWESVETYAGHNIIGYDLPVLHRLLGVPWSIDNVRFDTLILSRLVDFEIEGGHSLRNLSYHSGDIQKTEYTKGFETLNQEMIEYNRFDLRSGVGVLNWLKKKGKGTHVDAIKLEQKVQHYCNEIRDVGFKLDIELANNLLNEIASRSDKHSVELSSNYPMIPKPRVGSPIAKYRVKADGSLWGTTTKPIDGWVPHESVKGEYTVINWLPFSPSSRQQVVWQLLKKGWKPKKYTEKGSPIVDGDVLESLADEFPECKDIAEFFLLEKRRAQIKSWVDLYNPVTGRVHGSISTIGAKTHRASHANPNLAQVPGVKLGKDGHPLLGLEGKYNYECRSCWVAKEGCSIVGVDASAIQLVVLAHCMDDEAFTKAVSEGKSSEGTDVHTFNMNILRAAIQSITGEDSSYFTRPNSKTFIYAYLLGAGNAKIAQICGIMSSMGIKLREEFLGRLPKLKQYQDRLRAEVRKYKMIRSIDGRRYPCDDPHFALAFILQGYEALIMKKALIYTHEWLKEQPWYGHIVTWVHDEFQMEVEHGKEDIVIKQVVKFIEQAAKDLNFKCPLTGEGSYGTSWANSH